MSLGSKHGQRRDETARKMRDGAAMWAGERKRRSRKDILNFYFEAVVQAAKRCRIGHTPFNAATDGECASEAGDKDFWLLICWNGRYER